MVLELENPDRFVNIFCIPLELANSPCLKKSCSNCLKEVLYISSLIFCIVDCLFLNHNLSL